MTNISAAEKTIGAKLAIRDALLALLQINLAFKTSLLNDKNLPAWIMDDFSHFQAREKGAEITARLTYDEAQNRQETIKCPGIIAISEQTLHKGQQLNEKKDTFKQAMINYRSAFGHSFAMTKLSSKEIRQTLLGNLKLQHLHFVQVYRHIKLFPTAPLRVGFSWAATHTGAVKFPAHKAIEYLKSKFTQSKGLQNDISILERLPEHTDIIIRRPLSPHLRANLTWSEKIENLRSQNSLDKKMYPAQINTPLPLFICLNTDNAFPDFNKIKPFDKASKQDRLSRKDTRLKKLSTRAGSFIYTY